MHVCSKYTTYITSLKILYNPCRIVSTPKCLKRIVHFEINFWYVLSYLKGVGVGVFVSTVFSILTFFGQTGFVYQSYNAGLGGPPQRACTEKSKLNMIL